MQCQFHIKLCLLANFNVFYFELCKLIILRTEVLNQFNMSNLKLELAGNIQDENVYFFSNSAYVLTLACTVGGLER